MKISPNRGFIGLLVTMIVALAILINIGYNDYHDRPTGFTAQIWGQLERPGNILNHIISSLRDSFSTSTIKFVQ